MGNDMLYGGHRLALFLFLFICGFISVVSYHGLVFLIMELKGVMNL